MRKIFRQRTMADGSTEDAKKLALWMLMPDGSQRTLTTEEKREENDLPEGVRVFRADKVRDAGKLEGRDFVFSFLGENIEPGDKHSWRGDRAEMQRLYRADRLLRTTETLAYKYFLDDNWGVERTNYWEDTAGKIPDMRYVVETNEKVISRCILMTTDPGDLVFDPTCGSGTSAFAAERWGRRWITTDTLRVALALARARVMGARYPFYLLADSREGQLKEAQLTKRVPSEAPVSGNVRQGFVYDRVPHITLKSIANNAEIDVIYDDYQQKLESLREKLNAALKQNWVEWEIPRDAGDGWSKDAKQLHADWWEQRVVRQRAVDASIAAKAESELLYDKPHDDKDKVRVAGPFTVESLSPHRVFALDDAGNNFDATSDSDADVRDAANFVQVILDNLKTERRAASAQGRQDYVQLAYAMARGAGMCRGSLHQR